MNDLEKLKSSNKVVGTRRLLKVLEAGKVQKVYLAEDADSFIAEQVKTACAKMNVPVEKAPSMKWLGEACGVTVKTASCGVLK